MKFLRRTLIVASRVHPFSLLLPILIGFGNFIIFIGNLYF